MTDWKEWHGGSQPEETVGKLVEIELRNGGIILRSGNNLRWDHYGWDRDIVRYRVVDAEAKPNTPPKYVIAPQGCESYLTPGKRYEVYYWDVSRHCPSFDITADNGRDAFCILVGCPHLNGGDWIIPEGDDVETQYTDEPDAEPVKTLRDEFARAGWVMDKWDWKLRKVHRYLTPAPSTSALAGNTAPHETSTQSELDKDALIEDLAHRVGLLETVTCEGFYRVFAWSVRSAVVGFIFGFALGLYGPFGG